MYAAMAGSQIQEKGSRPLDLPTLGECRDVSASAALLGLGGGERARKKWIADSEAL